MGDVRDGASSPRPSATLAAPASPRLAVIVCAAFILLLMAALSLLRLDGFDYAVIHLVNSVSRRSFVLDHAMHDLTRDMFSNLVMMSLVWYAWFSTDDAERRAGLAVGVFMSFIAGVVSRGMQLILPAHPRPLHDPALGFRLPLGVDPDSLNRWSSFPSDHVAVFFGIVMTMFLFNRVIGLIAAIAAACLAFPRIYLGFHYPTDVIAGAMLPVIIVGLTDGLRLSGPVRRLMRAERTYRPLFYAASFYFCFGLATLFSDFRDVASGLAHALKVPVPH